MWCFSLQVRCYFTLSAFKTFSLIFRSWIMMCFGMDFFEFILWVRESWICGFQSSAIFGKFSANICQILFQLPCFSSPSGVHQHECESFCYSVTRPQGFLHSFSSPFFSSSDWLISVVLSSGLLILCPWFCHRSHLLSFNWGCYISQFQNFPFGPSLYL